MVEKGKIFKTFILFLFFLFGCSNKYADVEGEVVSSWQELDCEIVEQDEQGFSLGVQVKDFISEELSKSYIGSLDKGEEGVIPFLLGSVVAVGGCYGGLRCTNLSDWSSSPRWGEGCIVSAASWAAGLSIMKLGASKGAKFVKIIPNVAQVDTLCVDSTAVSVGKLKVLMGNTNFEKMYWTDKNGDSELKFNEIIPEPAETDSVLNLIIQYKEMVDTVDVEIK